MYKITVEFISNVEDAKKVREITCEDRYLEHEVQSEIEEWYETLCSHIDYYHFIGKLCDNKLHNMYGFEKDTYSYIPTDFIHHSFKENIPKATFDMVLPRYYLINRELESLNEMEYLKNGDDYIKRKLNITVYKVIKYV